MPRPSSVRKFAFEWRRELLEKRAAGRPLGAIVTYLPTSNQAPFTRGQGATLHDLYVQLNKRRAARERQARLVCVGLLPSVLALVLYLNW